MVGRPNRFSQSRLIVAAVLALLTPFGLFGIHDFILKKYLRGALHLILAIISIYFIFFHQFCDWTNPDECNRKTLEFLGLGILLMSISGIWMVIEAIIIIIDINNKPTHPGISK